MIFNFVIPDTLRDDDNVVAPDTFNEFLTFIPVLFIVHIVVSYTWIIISGLYNVKIHSISCFICEIVKIYSATYCGTVSTCYIITCYIF